jgi:hypothetical protein
MVASGVATNSHKNTLKFQIWDQRPWYPLALPNRCTFMLTDFPRAWLAGTSLSEQGGGNERRFCLRTDISCLKQCVELPAGTAHAFCSCEK